jgi:two-component system, OmpR family, response regulator RegX3
MFQYFSRTTPVKEQHMRIALLEDDIEQSDLLKLWLEKAGHSCHTSELGQDFIRKIGRESFDLFVLDWEIPDISGITVLEWIRKNIKEHIPVLFVTAHDTEKDIVTALEKGADDYMIKPMKQAELLARINALIRRSKPRSEPQGTLDFGAYSIDVHNRRITVNQADIPLTAKEYELATFLFKDHGKPLSRGHLLESIWGKDADKLDTRTVDSHISRVRKKLEISNANGWRLSSIHQYGYRMERVTASGDLAE